MSYLKVQPNRSSMMKTDVMHVTVTAIREAFAVGNYK